MTFLNPWFLFGGLAAGIPVALHFFYRAHYRPLPWAAMKFLRLALEQTSRRLRFQELVLLILRILVCLLLALALSRPAASSLTARGDRSDSVDAVIVIDTSYSMSAAETDKQTRLDKAKEAANKIIDNLPPNSTVQIVSCASTAKILGSASLSHDQARRLIKDLTTASLATDFYEGFSAAQTALNSLKDKSGSKEIYLISDMQRSGWERQTNAVRAKCQEIKDQATIYLVRCAEQQVQNVAIVGILPQTEIPHVNADIAFTVLLRNSGTGPVDNLNLTLTVDRQKEFSKDVAAITRIEPGESRAVTITGKLEQPGWQLLTARINEPAAKKEDGRPHDSDDAQSAPSRPNQDGIAEDNEYSVLIRVHERIRVLVVDGTPDNADPSKAGSFYLNQALLPVGKEQQDAHLKVTVLPPLNVRADSLGDNDICILANVAVNDLRPEFTEALEGFVRSGKGLFISTGENVKGSEYNESFKNVLPAPLRGEGPYLTPEENRSAADLASIDDYSFLVKFKEKGNNPLTTLNVAFTGAVTPVVDPATAPDKAQLGRVLLRFNDGRPMLLSKSIGAGEAMLLTTSIDHTWSYLCTTRAFAPFINGCLAHLAQRSNSIFNYTAGQLPQWSVLDSNKEYTVVRPDGERLPLAHFNVVLEAGFDPSKKAALVEVVRRRKDTDDNEAVQLVETAPKTIKEGVDRLTAQELQQELEEAGGKVSLQRLLTFDSSKAGVYRLVAAGAKEEEGERFVFNPDLSESENLEAITDQQIDTQLGFEPVHLKTGFDGKSFTGTERSRREWTVYVLWALLFFALGETLFAWFCGRAW